MLYTPPAFKLDDLPALHAHIEGCGLAMLVSVGEQGPLISHVPLFLDRTAGQFGTLTGHLAKANSQAKLTKLDQDVVAVFCGPDAYVSPSWYASKAEHGRVVPTWNYTVVHARGQLTFFDDPARLHAAVERLTAIHEARFPKPWSTSDAPADYVTGQLKGILGFELLITALEGKRKLSQNRPQADQTGVVAGLSASASPPDQAVADLMRGGPAG